LCYNIFVALSYKFLKEGETKMKKRIIAFAVLLVMVVAVFASCSTTEGLKIADLESQLQGTEEGLAFSKTSEGYVASKSGITSYKITATCDANDNITGIKAVFYDMNTSIITSASSIKTSISKSGGQMTMQDLRISKCVLMTVEIYEACGSSAIETRDEVLDAASVYYNGSKTIGDWSYVSIIDSSSKTVTLNATYNG
jgi:hypothetical protein